MKSDMLYQLPSGSFKYGDFLSSKLNYIEKVQLLDVDLWALFANQFKIRLDRNDNGWRGEYWGKMMRGACFVYSCTQNDKLYKIMENTVYDLLDKQDELGRIASYPADYEFKGWDLWSRKYVILGLEYFLEISKNEELNSKIIEALKKHTDYIISKIGPEEEGKTPITNTSNFWASMNSCSILEPVVRMYNLTNEQRYLDFASYIVSTGGCAKGNLFQLAFENQLYPYQYPVTKAYEMMSCFEGLLEYYRVTGEEKWRISVENFVDKLAESDVTLIGCSGCTEENFDNSSVRQYEITEKKVMQETCVTVTWMKLCYQIARLSGKSKYFDLIEQSAYNALFGALNTGMYVTNSGLPFDSYNPIFCRSRGSITAGGKYMENHSFYGCCAAIGSAGFGLVGLCGTMKTQKGVAINLYLDGTVCAKTPNGQSVEFKTQTAFPKDEKVTIKFTVENPEEFELSLRIPKWSKQTKITVNGKNMNNITAENYYTVNNIWSGENTVEIIFDMNVYAIWPSNYGLANQVKLLAFRRGPLILAGDSRLGYDISSEISPEMVDNSKVKHSIVDFDGFENIVCCDIKNLDGSTFRTVDYSSAGSLYNRSTVTALFRKI